MIIEQHEYFKTITADENKLIKSNNNDTVITKKLYVPLSMSDDVINCNYSEIDENDFLIVENNKKTYSKLQIRRACRQLGIESKLNELLQSNNLFYIDWQDAQDIDLDDPVLLQALELGNFSKEEIEKIKEIAG